MEEGTVTTVDGIAPPRIEAEETSEAGAEDGESGKTDGQIAASCREGSSTIDDHSIISMKSLHYRDEAVFQDIATSSRAHL